MGITHLERLSSLGWAWTGGVVLWTLQLYGAYCFCYNSNYYYCLHHTVHRDTVDADQKMFQQSKEMEDASTGAKGERRRQKRLHLNCLGRSIAKQVSDCYPAMLC